MLRLRTKIYYFSATGNCLAVAKQIAQSIGADMESIAKANRMEYIHLEHERIGIVFPAYLTPVMGVPLIVERFLRKIDNLEAARIFAVCTCGGYEFANAYAPLVKLRKRIRAWGASFPRSSRFGCR
jgi:flavodoxin